MRSRIYLGLDRQTEWPNEQLESELEKHFARIERQLTIIRRKLTEHADDKFLKGDELVGWLGEIYGKLLLNGVLVQDDLEHDFETPDGRKISVKARKGWGSGWNRSSAIPKIEGLIVQHT